MPMQSSALFHGIMDGDGDPVAPISLNGGTREGIINHNGTAVDAVRADDLFTDGEVVGSSHAGVGRVLVRIRVGAGPWTPRPTLWHRSAVAANPRRKPSGTRSSKLGFAVGVLLRQSWVEAGSPRQPS